MDAARIPSSFAMGSVIPPKEHLGNIFKRIR
jgi:hypothetical protein